MAFRKRKNIPLSFMGSVDEVFETDSKRFLSSVSVDVYRDRHKIPDEEFTLSEQLDSGVPLKEIPCSTLLDTNDPTQIPLNPDELLNTLTPSSESDNNN